MKTRIAISLLVLGTLAFAGCGSASGSDDASPAAREVSAVPTDDASPSSSAALPDCRAYRAAISRAYADPESTVIPSGLTGEDARAVTTDRQGFQSSVAAHAQGIAGRQAAADQARAAVAAGSTDLSDRLVSMPVTDDTAQYRQTLLSKWQSYVDQEIPRILSRQGCAS